MVNKYKMGVKYFFSHKWVAGIALIAVCVLLGVLVKTTKTGLIPDEDTGTVFVSVIHSTGQYSGRDRRHT